MKKTIKNIYDSHNNSFTILSIIMSITIIIFHCYPLFSVGGVGFISKHMNTENVGSVVVAMFFVISGFMITTSIKNSKNVFIYLHKRIKKIIPPLFLCLVISALIIPPLVLKINIFKYIIHPRNYFNYIFDNIFMIKNTVYNIFNTFKDNPYPYAINGSIWSLKHQFFMYLLMIPIFYAFIKNNKKNYFLIIFIVMFFFTIFSYTNYSDKFFEYIVKHFGKIGIFQEARLLVKLTYYFCAGIIINLYSDKIPVNKYIIFVLTIISILLFKTKYFPIFCLLLIPYMTILIGSIKSNIKITDISYHIYIWGFPIQQLIICCFKNINIYTYIILSVLIVVLISYISYFFSEYIFKKKKVIK